MCVCICICIYIYIYIYIYIFSRCRANVAHIRQSRPDSGTGFKAKMLKTF